MSFITDPEKTKNLSQATIEQSPHGILWIDSDGKIRNANNTACELLGFTKEEFFSKKIPDFDIGFPWESFSEFWIQIKEKKRMSFESGIKSKAGKYIPVEVSVYYVDCGDVGYLCGTFKDITERKLSEDKIKENEEKYRSVFEKSQNAIMIFNADFNVVAANPSAVKLYGYTEEEFQKLNVVDITTEETFEENGEKLRKAIKNGEDYLFEATDIKKDGTEFNVLVKLTPFIFNNEKHALAINTDITNQKKSENKLKEKEKLLNIILNNQFQLNGLIDLNGKLILVNKTALNFLNLKKEDVVGKSFWETPWWYHSDKEKNKIKEAVEKSLKGEFLRFETININKEGQIRYLDNSFTPLFDSEGNVEFIIPEARDITERIEILERLEKANVELIDLKNRLEAENIYLREEIKSDHNFGDMIGNSSEFIKMLEQIKNVAPTDANVLVLGETGTGKELIARAIHNLSNRKNHPLVKVNCASLPTNLIESELFGHEKGAFTGAVSQKKGRFELADQGTIFLDEIGEIPLELQAKLLRVLQEGEFERIGSVYTKKVDVRIIAATNRNLEKLVLDGKFREDLYYRLNVFPVTSPPLRNREEDIPILVKYFIDKFNSKANKKIDTIPQKIMNQLITYSWPGNIRELENIIERAVIISLGNKLELGDWFCRSGNIKNDDLYRSLDDVEKEHILKVLEKTNGKIRGEDGAALILGLKPTTLEARMLKLGIKK